MKLVSGSSCLAFVAMALAVPASAATWVRTWEAPPVEQPFIHDDHPLAHASNVTLRMVTRVSAGGSSLRLRLSNELTDVPLPIGAVHVALADASGNPRPGTDRVVTFGGLAAPTIPAFAPLASDPVSLNVPSLGSLVVSIHVPGDTSKITLHPLGVQTALIGSGNQVGASSIADSKKSTQRFVLSGVDVSGGPATETIVTLGDSITDGALSTDDANHRWPDILAERLKAAGMTRLAVANAGISGNRLLLTNAGPAALARLDRDVLSVPGIRYLIVLEGINDIGWAKNAGVAPPKPEEIIAAYRQIIDRAHAHGVKVYGATVLPYKGAGYSSEEGEAVRQAVNAWTRAPGHFDAVIDFDRATADPKDPLAMAPAYDSGDHLHPKDEGYRAMAEAVDLKLFK